MFKLFITVTLCGIFSLCHMSSAFAANQKRSEASLVACSPQLQEVVNTIQKLPEARKLINDIQKEGRISITVNRSSILKDFGAFWDPDERIISINLSSDSSKGSIIGSILFELHNAFGNSKINYLDDLASKGQISKSNYVREKEYLEYENSLNASQLAEKGIQQGLFPANARLPTYRNFEEHYYYQKIGGHSAWVAHIYDQLAPKNRQS